MIDGWMDGYLLVAQGYQRPCIHVICLIQYLHEYLPVSKAVHRLDGDGGFTGYHVVKLTDRVKGDSLHGSILVHVHGDRCEGHDGIHGIELGAEFCTDFGLGR